MKKIALASHNPVKVAATRGGFERLFPQEALVLERVSVPSGVRDQPYSDEETLRGAENRARGALAAAPGCDFGVGLEGGIVDDGECMIAFAWVVIRSAERRGSSRTATFELPPRVAQLVRQGKELGEADDLVFGHTNSKHQGGAVGLLTDGVIDRRGLYEPAVSLALIPFIKAELF